MTLLRIDTVESNTPGVYEKGTIKQESKTKITKFKMVS
jgi:hypothetical protein